MTRRDAIRRGTLLDGAELVVGAGIGAQIMAATGADTVAKQVRSVAASAANKPGYGPLVRPARSRFRPASRSSRSARPARR